MCYKDMRSNLDKLIDSSELKSDKNFKFELKQKALKDNKLISAMRQIKPFEWKNM